MKRIPGALVATALSVLVLVCMGFAGAYQYLVPEIPDAASLRDVRTQLPLRVYTRDGKLLAQIGEQRRIPVAFDEIPAVVIDAFLAAEDARFYEHPGVDWQSLVRAVVANVSARSAREGGGTITMQLARNTVLTSEKTLRRKLKEVFLAMRLEREFSKQEILTLYLNRIFLGQRSYGIGAAAEVYFDKPVHDLTVAEAALIAGLPRSPSLDNPVASVERARYRRAYVLRRMLELGKIDQARHDAALDEPISSRLHGPIIELDAPYAAEMVRAEMVRQHGADALTAGYQVYTTLDSRLQQAANAATWRTILEYERRHGFRGPLERIDPAQLGDAATLNQVFKRNPQRGSLRPAVVTAVADRSAGLILRNGSAFTLDWDGLSWARPVIDPLKDALGPYPKAARDVLAPGDVVYVEPLPDSRYRLGQLPAVSGALVALDPVDGAIVSLVGGFDFGSSKYNRVVQAQRQPGSAFKPFLYSAALERGFTPATLVNDAPIVLPGGGGAEGDEEWRPQNITRKFYGPTPMREGLVRSRNLVSIRLLRGAGIGFAVQHIAQFGFGPQSLPANLTLALGTGQVTPLEMARGFAVFANGGALVTPYFIQSVQDSGGQELFHAEPARACGLCDFDAAGDAAAAVAGGLAAVPAVANEAPNGAAAVKTGTGVPRAPQAISPANAFVMTDMMTDVIQRGTAQRAAAALNRKDIAGKTGTTSDRRDTWFVGFNADIVAAVWLGFDQERSLGENEEGGKTALPMWIYFMQEALRDRPEHRQPEPPGVVRMWVSRESGAPMRAGASGALFEAFLEQYAPQPGMGGFGDDGVGAETIAPAAGDESIF
ncbi:MAG: penicillin-binding protein 1A [Gammaproteobacteria bacterium]|nr:penicillin-binding protein 1A [Gammaproteobacteria bacterium]MDH5273275.1 penicillin-binding protein 1A [Gammaproteobacteria bacterium]